MGLAAHAGTLTFQIAVEHSLNDRVRLRELSSLHRNGSPLREARNCILQCFCTRVLANNGVLLKLNLQEMDLRRLAMTVAQTWRDAAWLFPCTVFHA